MKVLIESSGNFNLPTDASSVSFDAPLITGVVPSNVCACMHACMHGCMHGCMCICICMQTCMSVAHVWYADPWLTGCSSPHAVA